MAWPAARFVLNSQEVWFFPFLLFLRATLVVNNNACQSQMIYAALMAFFIFHNLLPTGAHK